MGTTSSTIMQSLAEIEQRAPPVGAKMWCLFLYPQDAVKRQTAGIKFTHRPKIRFFAPQGRLCTGATLHRFMSNLAGTTDTWVRLAVQNFTSIAPGGGNAVPKNIKNFHFLVMSRPVGATLYQKMEMVHSTKNGNGRGDSLPKKWKWYIVQKIEMVHSSHSSLPFWNMFRGFYTPNYPTLVFQISYDSHHRLRSYC